MATFVLIHGAWHGNWCWELLAPLLRLHSHKVIAPDLPFMDQDDRDGPDDVLAVWADLVAEEVSAQSEPVILVGHSRGGLIVSEVAERVPDKVAASVYLAAFLIPPGESLDSNRDRLGDGPDLLPALRPTADFRKSRFSSEHAEALFYNRVRAEWLPSLCARLGWEPHAAHATELQLTSERYGGVPRVYIETLADKVISPALQRDMQQRQPCERVHTLEADHSPFYSAPCELADVLDRIAGEVLPEA